ncbi:hypothetical protein D9758_016738 [Tetrapyrgos nigripes]|uniref:F-box domain-containing protein n=1 Tax=Tetrapyrgos nigripes TaxID=182062 RepID=A0A8H5FH78_9AGAR|nr:hypothetical protein D9758_016738 [Tetrapyrgos nigripes]
MPNRRRQKKSSLKGFLQLPNEIKLEIMNCSRYTEHAAMLRVSKDLYDLGVNSLYRSLTITYLSMATKLTRTFGEPSGEKLALQVKYFKVLLNDPISPTKLEIILQRIKNASTIQIYLKFRALSAHDIMYFYQDALFSKTFSNLTELTILLPATQEYILEFFDFLRRHPQIARLQIFTYIVDRLAVLVQPTQLRDVEPMSLPALRSYRGPILVLKHILRNACSLTQVTLDITKDNLTKADDHLQCLSQLKGRADRWDENDERTNQLSTSISPARSLTFEVIMSPVDLYLLDQVVCFLPDDLETLSIRFSYQTGDLINADGAVFTVPGRFGERILEFTNLKTFMINCAATQHNRRMLELDMPQRMARSLTGSFQTLQRAVFCGRHFHREADEWLAMSSS